ncbi:3-keto-5-aminohexanoate cleavage protein [Rhodococcus sp. NPDC055112]
MSSGKPLVIEAAINGSRSKMANPNVPRTVEEIFATTLACVDAGASIVHNHNDEPNFGEPSVHSADPYEAAWRQIWATRPGLLLHPTTSGERSSAIAERFSHIVELHQRGALS